LGRTQNNELTRLGRTQKDELTQIGITQKNELIGLGRTQKDEQTAFRCFRCEISAYKEWTVKILVKFSEGSTAGEAEETGVFINIHTLLYLDWMKTSQTIKKILQLQLD
jgi:hypothetical protein